MRYGLYGSRYGVSPYVATSTRTNGLGVAGAWVLAILFGIIGATIWSFLG